MKLSLRHSACWFSGDESSVHYIQQSGNNQAWEGVEDIWIVYSRNVCTQPAKSCQGGKTDDY